MPYYERDGLTIYCGDNRQILPTLNLDLANAEEGIDGRLLSRLREGTESASGWVRLLSLPAADFRPWAG